MLFSSLWQIQEEEEQQQQPIETDRSRQMFERCRELFFSFANENDIKMNTTTRKSFADWSFFVREFRFSTRRTNERRKKAKQVEFVGNETMLSRSSSFSSTTNESRNENLKSTTNVLRHHESLQSLPQISRPTRPMLSRPMNIEHSNPSENVKKPVLQATQNLPSTTNPSETIKRSIVRDDLENLQERLNEILISGPTHDVETSILPTEQPSTTEYFTPKISIDENLKKKKNEDETTDDDDDFDRKTKHFSLCKTFSFSSFSVDQRTNGVTSVFRCSFEHIV